MRVLLLMAMLLLFGCEKADNHPVKATPPTDGFHVYKASALGNLPIGSTLSFDIDEPLTVSTITPTSLLLVQIEEDANRTLAYSFTYENKRLSIKPDKPLLGGSTCRITFTPAIKSTRGFGLKEALSFEFSVQTSGDTAIPQLLRIEPQASERLYTNSRFFVHFSKPLLDYDIDACFVLEDNATGEQVPATYTLFYNTVMITPDEPLNTSTTYQVRYDHPVFALNGLESNSSANVTRYYTSSPIAMPEIEGGIVIIDANQSQLRNPTVLEVSSFSPTALPQTPGDISVTLAPSLNQQENAVVYVGGNGGLERWEVASDGVTFASMRHYDYAHEVVSLLSVAQNRVLIGHTSGMDLVEFNDGTLSIKDSIALDTPAYALDGNGTHIAVALLSKGHALYSLANDKLELVRMMAPNSEVNSTTGIDLSGSDANMITDVAFTSYETTRYLTTCSYLNGVTQYELNGTKVSSSRVDGTACLKLKASGNYLNVIKGASGVSRYFMTGVTPNAFTDEFTVRTFSADALGLSYPYDAFIADRFGGAVLYEYGAGKRLAQNIQALRIEALTSNKKFALILERSGALKIINTQPDVISPSVSSVKAEGGNSEVSSVVVSFSEDIKATNFAEFITLTSGSGSVSYSVNVISSSEVNLTLATPLDISNSNLNISIAGLQDDYGNTINPYSATVDVSALKTGSAKAPKLVALPSLTKGVELWLVNGAEGSNQITELVTDINTKTVESGFVLPKQVGTTLYFIATDGIHGYELWKSDGTEAGTQMVIDLTPGTASTSISQMASYNNQLYFSARDGNGTELWKSDGTAAGTVMVRDINPGSGDSYPTRFLVFNGYLYFTAYEPTTGSELWRTGGDESNTTLVSDIRTGTAASSVSNLTLFNGALYFVADDGVTGSELWKVDSSNTVTRVSDLNPGVNSASIQAMAVYNGALYFSGTDGTTGVELWRNESNDTQTLVHDLNPGTNGTNPRNFYVVGGVLYFTATLFRGSELFFTTGSYATEVDINPGTPSSGPSNLTEYNDKLYFVANDGVNGRELWESNGSTAGTVMVSDIIAGSSGSFLGELTVANNLLFFRADDAVVGSELRRVDSNGVVSLVKDIYPGTPSASPFYLTAFNNRLYFRADDDLYGQTVWQSDGTDTGTIPLKDINSNTKTGVDNFKNKSLEINGVYYFVGTDGNGSELWKNDGTVAGTVIVKDIYPGSQSSYPSDFTVLNGILYFRADNGVNGQELWRSDGTQAGTYMVADVYPGVENGGASYLEAVGNQIFFASFDGVYGNELWVSGGDESNTSLFNNQEINPFGDAFPYAMTNVNGVLFLDASDPDFGAELFKVEDGNISLVKDINNGSGYASPSDLTNVNGDLFFKATNGINGYELWRSRGTDATTTIFNINTTPTGVAGEDEGSSPKNFYNANGVLYFAATDNNSTQALYKFDPADDNFTRISTLDDNNGTSTSTSFEAVGTLGNLLIYTSGYYSFGYSLWRSDGTPAGTFKLTDLNPTTVGDSYIVNDRVIFTKERDDGGYDLYISDGSVAGTKLYKSEL